LPFLGGLCEHGDTSCTVVHNISQTLWPDHCVIDTYGANFSNQLDVRDDDIIIKKGYHCQVSTVITFKHSFSP